MNTKKDLIKTPHESATSSNTLNYESYDVDMENNDEDDIVCIGIVSSTSKPSCHEEHEPIHSTTVKQGTSQRNRIRQIVIDVENNDIEIINVDCDNDERINEASTSRFEPKVIDIEDEDYIDEDLDDKNYTLRIDDSPSPSESNVIDVEENSREIENEQTTEKDHTTGIRFRNQTAEDSDSQPEQPSNTTQLVEAVVHEDPTSHDCSNISNISEIEDYDAKMRQHFESELNSSEYLSANDYTFNSSTFDEWNQSANSISRGKDSMECDSDISQIIEIKDEEDSNDDCIITSVPAVNDVDSRTSPIDGKLSSTQNLVATIDVDQHDEKKKRRKITETEDEIFHRMMPSCVPGVLSLCASEAHCLPTNVRPFKFCYFYHVTAHLIVKEIQKNEFFKIKDQMLVAKKTVQPCTCLSHPLNQNASKLTLLTNPQSLYHRSHCYFAQNSKKNRQNRPKGPRRPRRLTYQVTFCRVPRKRDSKDFKDWADVIINRKHNSSHSSISDQENSLVEHKPFVCKSESDSWVGDTKPEPFD